MDNRLKQFVIDNDGVWPNDGPHGKYCLFGGVDLLVDHEAFMKARAELGSKPAWSEAPEWARWLAQESDGTWVWRENKPVDIAYEWKQLHHGRSRAASFGHVFGDWRNTLEERPERKPSGYDWAIKWGNEERKFYRNNDGQREVYLHGEWVPIGGKPLEPQYQDVMDLINAIVEISQTADNTEDSEIQDALMDIVTRLGGILANRFTREQAKCWMCKGTGILKTMRDIGIVHKSRCDQCNGTGVES